MKKILIVLMLSLMLIGCDKKEEVKPVKIEYKTIEYKGYLYTLPDKTFAKIENGKTLHLYNNLDVWASYIKLVDKELIGDVLDDVDALQNKIIENGFDVSEPTKIVKNGKTYYAFRCNHNGNVPTLIYTEAYDNYLYEIAIFAGKENNTYNERAVDIILEVIERKKKLDNSTQENITQVNTTEAE